MSTKKCRAFGLIGRQATSSLSFVIGLGLVAALGATPSLAAAPSQAGTEILNVFHRTNVVSAAELARLRGGFMMPNGSLVQFGFKVQQFVNDTLKNVVTVGPVDLANGVVQNNFTVTQTTPSGTTTTHPTSLPAGGFTFPVTANDGKTNLTVNIGSSSVQTLIQNRADNLSLRSVTTVDVATQKLMPALNAAVAASQMIHTIQSNSWLQR